MDTRINMGTFSLYSSSVLIVRIPTENYTDDARNENITNETFIIISQT